MSRYYLTPIARTPQPSPAFRDWYAIRDRETGRTIQNVMGRGEADRMVSEMNRIPSAPVLL